MTASSVLCSVSSSHGIFMSPVSLCFPLQISPASPNGPCIPIEAFPQEAQKGFVREMKHPVLRQGYVPIAVHHDNIDLRQPCFSYVQPSGLQNIRADGRTPSPTPTIHCRARSPVHINSESFHGDPHCTSCSPVSQGPEVRHRQSLTFVYHLIVILSYYIEGTM